MYEIENLKKSNPKQFWQYVKANKRQNQSNDQFKTFFSNISNNTEDCNNNKAETFRENHDFNCLNDKSPELDNPITIDEIKNAIKSLKCGKAFGNDCILNEYFIECADILAMHLCDLFNGILNSGFYPTSWTEGAIIPIHTKGPTNDVNNDRGITIVSCFSKLFRFCSQNDVISDAQFGFRKGRSTVDAIYTLMTVIQKYMNNNKRLYVVFVDLMKCFNTI